jgi:hypothetical protein
MKSINSIECDFGWKEKSLTICNIILKRSLGWVRNYIVISVRNAVKGRNFSLIAIALLFFNVFPNVYGEDNSSCIQSLRDIYKKMNSIPETTDGKTIYYMNFNIKTTLRKQSLEPSLSDVELMVGKNQMRYLSREMVIYEDEKNSFTVIPSRETIYWGDSNIGHNKNQREKRMTILQDTLFDLCSLEECRNVNQSKEGYDRIIVLKASSEAQKLFGMNKLTFFVNSITDQIKKISIEYPDNNQVSSVEMTYNSINYNYQKNNFSRPVKSFFMDDKQELLSAYKQYQLIDNRKKQIQ